MNRLFGLAPFELIRNQKGVLVGFRTGKAWFGYSAALITISGMFAFIHVYPSTTERRTSCSCSGRPVTNLVLFQDIPFEIL